MTDDDVRCSTCRHWVRRHGARGWCENPANYDPPVIENGQIMDGNRMNTTDRASCSLHERIPVDTCGQIMAEPHEAA